MCQNVPLLTKIKKYTKNMPKCYGRTKNRPNNVKMYRNVQTTLIRLKRTTVRKIYQSWLNMS